MDGDYDPEYDGFMQLHNKVLVSTCSTQIEPVKNAVEVAARLFFCHRTWLRFHG